MLQKILFLFLLLAAITHAQTITGRVINQTGHQLSDKRVDVYLNNGSSRKRLSDTTDSEGRFTVINIIDGIEKSVVPKGYLISEPYPNPFNPLHTLILLFLKSPASEFSYTMSSERR